MKQESFGSKHRPANLEKASEQIARERLARKVKAIVQENKKLKAALVKERERYKPPAPKRSLLTRAKQNFVNWRRRIFS